MANKYIISKAKLTAIADAIRTKTGGTATLTADQMATAITNIKAGDEASEWCRKAINRELSGAVKVPDGITSLPPYFWYNNNSSSSITEINLNDVEDVPDYLFSTGTYNQLSKITMTDRQKSIGYQAFYGAAITSLVIPASVEEIYYKAFANCANLASVIIEGDSNSRRLNLAYDEVFSFTPSFFVKSAADITVKCNRDVTFNMGKEFGGRSGSIYLMTGGCICSSSAFDEFAGKIYVPSEYLDHYKTATNWSKYADIIVSQ